MKKLFSLLLTVICLSSVCFAADMIFFGFDDDAIPSNLEPNVGYTISGGIVSFKNITSTDPYLTYSCNVKADDYSCIMVRIKHELTERDDKKTPICQMYYNGTDATGGAIALVENNSVKTDLVGLSSGGKYITYKINLDKSNLKGATLKSMRFDIVNCKGSYDLDYIMLVPKNPNPDYIYEFNSNGNSEGWWHANLTAAPTVANGVISGQNKASNGLLDITMPVMLNGSDYPKMYVRSKIDGITETERGLIYTDLYDDKGNSLKTGGWWTAYQGYSNVGISNTVANNNKFVLHTYDFTGKTAYLNNRFKYIVLNMVEHDTATFEVDYIALKNKKSYEWTFDHEGFTEGWSKPSGFALANGAMNYTSGDTYANPLFELNNVSIDASNYDGFEIIMKHNLKPDSRTDDTVPTSSDIRLYYSGKSANGTTIELAEVNTAKAIIGQTTGDSYVRYYIDLTAKSNWKGSTITNLRLDPVNENGDFSIDYMRLVPNETAGMSEIDTSLVTATYEFEDDIAGNADGKIKVNLGMQGYNNIKKMTISWADENGTALSDYSMIRAFINGEFDGTYTIDKNMLIPDDARKIVINITDIKKTFSVTVDIPASKLPKDLGEPLYTVALISDIHVGGWGSENTPNSRLVAAREQINKYADFVVINGDLTQWYGARSQAEFKKFNFNGTTYTDNGETDITILDQNLGTSQWEVLTEYFESFQIPVYPVQGNHDIRDGDGWNKVYYRPEYWLNTFHSWLDYSNSAQSGTQKYTNPVTYSTAHNYYDAVIGGNHFIFLEMPKIPSPYYAFGSEQLAWLDKKLYEKEATGKPIFVFTHVPTNSNLNASYWDDQIKDDAAFKAVLAKHPTAIVVSGHTHYSLDVDVYSSLNGAQEQFSIIHDGGTTTVNVPNGTNYNDTTETENSHGVIAEVYADRILLKGRDFVNDKWISRGYTLITFKNAPDFSVSAARTTDASGNTVLTATNINDEYTYTWVVDGVESAGTSVTLSGTPDYAALRVADKNGLYASELYDDITSLPVTEPDALTVNNGVVKVKGVKAPSYLVIASYKGIRVHDVYLQPVSADCTVNISDTTLDTNGCSKITAFILKRASLSPIFPAVTE